MKFLVPRVDCKSPQQYYTCASNGFKGCCSVDPCPLSGCPTQRDSTASPDDQPKSVGSSTKSKDDSGNEDASTSKPKTTVRTLVTVNITPTSIPITITQLPLTPSQGQATQRAGSSPSLASSSQAPFTIVVVSTAVQTPTSNGVALASTTFLITTTSYSSPAVAVQTPSSASGAVAGTASSSNGPVIGGVVGGVGGGLIAVALLWFCFRRRSKKRKDMREEKAAHGHEDDPREQGIDANRAGDVIAGYRGTGPNRGADRQSKVKARESMAGSESTIDYGHNGEKNFPTPPVTPNRQAYAEDAVPYLDSTPVRPNLEMTGSSPNPIGFTPELSGAAAVRQPAELSPEPERLRINNRSSAYSEVGNAGPRTSNGGIMRSNLNLSNRGANRRAPNGAARHVLSWMEYGPNSSPRTDGTESSPTSGVWSTAESSNFVRDSGVSQDSSTPGWQRERRIKDGGGGLEAIPDGRRI